MYVLGIDVGTSGTKTVLFTQDGQVVASQTREYPLYQPENGWAEQEPEDWWQAAVSTIRGVLEESGVRPEEIAGVGLSGQMHGLVMLGERGEALRRSIIWCDGRTGKQCEEITERVGARRLVEITANPALAGFTASKILWVREHEPEVYAKCRHILLPKDYIRYRLTGELATEVSDASGMQLLDVPARRWSGEVLDALEIDRGLLAEVYESVEVSGKVSAQAASLTGLFAGTIVVGGAGDNAAAAVGTGVVTDGAAFTTIGSSGVVYTHTSELAIDPKGRVHTFCCAVPGAWHIMGVTQAAGLSLKWFRDNFCMDYQASAAAQGLDPYILMTADAAQVPIGSNRLLFLPYLMGERTPHLDPNCRGMFFGLSAIHTRRDILRAVMEGVAFSLKDCYEILREMGAQPAEMIACGGGGRSALWRQMMADLFGCPVCTVAQEEGPALGVAILAAVGAGLYPNVPEACAKIIAKNREQAPILTNSAEYQKYYAIYQTLYAANKAGFDALAQLG